MKNPTALEAPKTKLPLGQQFFNLVMLAGLVGVAFLAWNAQRDISHLRDTRLFVRQAAFDAISQGTDTEGWQTYRNESYKVEFQYPPEWKIERITNEIEGVRGISAKRDDMTIFLYQLGPYDDVAIGEKEPVLIDGKKFNEYRQESTIDIPLTESSLISFRSANLLVEEPIFRLMLSTFRFLD